MFLKSIESLRQQSRWRLKRQAWKERIEEAAERFDLPIDLIIFSDFISGTSYEACAKKYEVSVYLIKKIVTYWADQANQRLRRGKKKTKVVEQPVKKPLTLESFLDSQEQERERCKRR